MPRLAHRIAVPADPQPGELGDRRRDMRLARPAAVAIVDADTAAPAGAARGIMDEKPAIGVAEVARAGRAGPGSGQARPRHPPYIAAHAPLTEDTTHCRHKDH